MPPSGFAATAARVPTPNSELPGHHSVAFTSSLKFKTSLLFNGLNSQKDCICIFFSLLAIFLLKVVTKST